MMIELDFSRSKLRTKSIIEYSDKIIHYDKELEKEANRNDKMVGWMFLPEKYDKEEVKSTVLQLSETNKKFLKDIIEVLKTLLFTLCGYLFGKNEQE